MLDLSAAFNTVHHTNLLWRLNTSYGLQGSTLHWFSSSLDGRTQSIHCGSTSSTSVCRRASAMLHHGCTLIASSLTCQVRSPLVLVGPPTASDPRHATCRWRRRRLISPQCPHLSIYIDCDISIWIHVAKTASSRFCALRQIRSIRRTVCKPVLLSLVIAMVLARLDYGSATLASLPDLLHGKLQSVFNAAARLVSSGRKYDHVTSLLRDLHWLPFTERITFILAVSIGSACLSVPTWSADLHRVVYADSRRRLRSTSMALLVPRTRLRTVHDRAFPVAAARAWNNLPPSVTSALSLCTFRKRLKTELFSRRFSS